MIIIKRVYLKSNLIYLHPAQNPLEKNETIMLSCELRDYIEHIDICNT